MRIALVFLWVLHLAALIGIAIGYEDFFLPKSPFTIMYLLFFLIFFFKIDSRNKVLLFIAFMMIGIGVEWLGVHTGSLFGDYYYGKNFGPKLDGIPVLIGVNWALLTFTTHVIAKSIFKSPIAIIASGATLMVGFDYFLEQICDFAGFWHFEGGAGWFNYLCWFIIAAALHAVSFQFKLRGNKLISYHLYGVQLFFAISLWIIISI
ncbi:carotenoid biosynthesis protein [Nonlabens sp. Ci31]|jgi:putative membrane protein|uniref:carotenoid biosynthesis protein n=1 Tax=Nonlabens sp. Ci31 TaxID=2608253 RepID=UPI001463CFA4|nr:carotenoid biosynthesis protein [Nonlabens sp. Ci31]QJP34606.1 carotenoid biosynthesis protein [Nonlabens sp. Ci31]